MKTKLVPRQIIKIQSGTVDLGELRAKIPLVKADPIRDCKLFITGVFTGDIVAEITILTTLN